MKTYVSAALVLVLACAGPAFAQHKRGLVWDDRPSIVFGEDVNVDLRAKLQFDWRTFDPQIDEDTYDFRTARVGLKGDLTKHFDFEIERAIDTGDSGFGDWKDVYLNWSTFDALRVKAGQIQDALWPRAEHRVRPTSTLHIEVWLRRSSRPGAIAA